MKAYAIRLILILSLLSACGNKNSPHANTDFDAYDNGYEEDFTTESNFETEPSKTESKLGFFEKLGKKKLKTHQFRDARTGLVVSSSNYPADWTVISKPNYTMDQKIPIFLTQIQGPNNLKSFNTPLRAHISYQNPQTYQFMRNSTAANLHRPMISNQRIIEEEVLPRMQNSGFSFMENIRLPKLEDYLRGKINAESGGQVKLDITTTVWKNNNGQKALATVGKIYMQQPLSYIDTMTLWMYSTDYMFVDEDHFTETISTFENALINSKENPQWKQYVAQLNQLRAQKAAQQHQINMQNRQAAFNAHQQKMKGIWAAQDANHASFMNRTFGSSSDTSHKNFLNMINEEETVYNPLNGKNYQVDAGSTQYWMDSEGNYIKNDDLFYNPNGGINLGNREWTKVGKAF
ncbi:hypothetical protein [Arenibacter sp. ARW7G5Y1]|uniref:hypothetical protein n=1 Tax=Arenibacter sp. ARW7G5Y1 TaxID=2135619 RepID=UPI000D75F460|nr:hypothetical protein [Arenibacter sp. ARW7G5Y1]PXX27225.1 hypothetical protein C7972_1078 [Arenibacter sp. ARW7G5Y1]|tara:strand:- start:8260 stop:9474 length:1215 start_codon:yes stop_codon:yes gene_type:complete